jgi:glycerophosphoryl diester phosphodiesterase
MKVRLLPLFALAFASVTSAVEIVAHRGASHDAPENTLVSQELAWKHRADAAELDVHLTKDRKLAVMHDPTLKRTTGQEGKFEDFTLAELRQFDAGSWKGPQFAGEKIPTLDEMLAHIPAGKRIIIHLKVGAEIVPELVASLKRNNITPQQAAIISFDFAPLKAVKKALPAYPALWLINAPATGAKKKKSPTLDELIRDCRAAGFNGLSFNQNWPLDDEGSKKIKAAGLALHVWTVDLPQIAQRWIDLGVDAITTNRAGWLREQLKL